MSHAQDGPRNEPPESYRRDDWQPPRSAQRRRRTPLVVLCAVVVIVALVVAVDFGFNAGKAYSGVSVGGLDVSGMTESEIVALLEDVYGDHLEQTVITVTDEDGTASWTLSASDIHAYISAEELAEQALAVGREGIGIVERIQAALNGCDIAVTLSYDEEALEEFALELDELLGTTLVDYGFVIENGVATVTAGTDGLVVDRDDLAQQVTAVLLDVEGSTTTITVELAYSAVRIDEAAAQAVCDQINAVIADGATFTCGTGTLVVSASELGSWIVGVVEQTEDGYSLVPHIDSTLAADSLAAFAWQYFNGGDYTVSFTEDDEGEIWVTIEDCDSAPMTDAALEELEAALFDDEVSSPVIAIEFGEGTGTLSFDDALSLGVIVAFSSYTTSFNTGSSYANRISNIAQAAEYLTNSIIDPGESWSFNETCGERTTARGFLPAAAIVYGEYTTDVGGGICQVATTVFNCIYEAGLKITERHNHSLYISSYPTGRDAAVSWPSLDLVWENDTDSSILLCVTCGESTVTVTLYGVDPGYEVTTEVGEWQDGEEYETITEVDETLEPGESYVETAGVNGKKITVTRTVTDSEGNVVRTDTFTSSYAATDEVIVTGPEVEEEEEEEETEAEEETETDSEEVEETATDDTTTEVEVEVEAETESESESESTSSDTADETDTTDDETGGDESSG